MRTRAACGREFRTLADVPEGLAVGGCPLSAAHTFTDKLLLPVGQLRRTGLRPSDVPPAPALRDFTMYHQGRSHDNQDFYYRAAALGPLLPERHAITEPRCCNRGDRCPTRGRRRFADAATGGTFILGKANYEGATARLSNSKGTPLSLSAPANVARWRSTGRPWWPT